MLRKKESGYPRTSIFLDHSNHFLNSSWTIQTPSGLILYQSKYRKHCFEYVKQAIAKGADRNNLILRKLKEEN